jgi:ATP-dependent 26S proteasome regulatory subunit
MDLVTLISQVAMYSIKQEPTGDSETCLASCATEHEMVTIKEEKTSVVTEDPIEKTEREVNSNVSLLHRFSHFIELCLTP